ncbi:lipopolysaccharide heptosyltransferase I [Megamonas hypermegale]|uniref:glycosyltransferase family 9 protein n=1 Tax=Megamonas hypermegale TaxID=158847 RepID=UPI000B39DF71|nr:glycosyltransferase family 9 protein [Megamonas hypermegale]OUO38844.1 lipopolysaccharide heptosyltransferase I [Megamonas hypermegale]
MNILIVKLSAIGDVIHALPVSYALRQKYPTAHITWVVEPTAYEIVKHNPCVDEVILFQKKSFKTFKGFREKFKPFYKLLHQRKYDISIDLQGLFKSMAVVLTANAKKKIGCVDMREGSNLISKAIKGPHFNGHIVDRYLDTVKYLGCDTDNIIFPLKNTAEEINYVNNLLMDNKIDDNKPFIVFAVGTNWVNKCWSTKNFAILSDLLSEHSIKTVLIGFGKNDEQKALEITRQNTSNNIVNLVGKTSLMQTAALIKKAKAIVGGDTGNLHLAAALNIPAIMLMGPTDPNRNGPYKQLHNVILAGHDCDGCWKRTCHKNIDCLSTITPNQVLKKILKIEMFTNE